MSSLGVSRLAVRAKAELHLELQKGLVQPVAVALQPVKTMPFSVSIC